MTKDLCLSNVSQACQARLKQKGCFFQQLFDRKRAGAPKWTLFHLSIVVMCEYGSNIFPPSSDVYGKVLDLEPVLHLLPDNFRPPHGFSGESKCKASLMDLKLGRCYFFPPTHSMTDAMVSHHELWVASRIQETKPFWQRCFSLMLFHHSKNYPRLNSLWQSEKAGGGWAMIDRWVSEGLLLLCEVLSP